jgi:hypothetical protein
MAYIVLIFNYVRYCVGSIYCTVSTRMYVKTFTLHTKIHIFDDISSPEKAYIPPSYVLT